MYCITSILFRIQLQLRQPVIIFFQFISEGSNHSWCSCRDSSISRGMSRLLPGNCCITLRASLLCESHIVGLKHLPGEMENYRNIMYCQLFHSRSRQMKRLGVELLPVLLTGGLLPTDLKIILGTRMSPTISKEVTKLSTTKNRRNKKKDCTPPPKFPVG